jgi:arginase
MPDRLTIIGVPSSAGAYAPGQEKAPAALRDADLPELLSTHEIPFEDQGDVSDFRWQPDPANPRAMNASVVERVAKSTAAIVSAALDEDNALLILGGDCTVELGVVAGILAHTENIGLVYIDLDTDLNTPESTTDGALDWMGVAHLLGIDGTVPELVELGPRTPMLQPHQIHFFANDNSEPFERNIIKEHGIAETPLADVEADPAQAGQTVAMGWGQQFDRLLIHLDVDVLDFAEFPIAENTRRNRGLQFDQLMETLRPLVGAPNFTALTITEVNPDHTDEDGSTLRTFVEALVKVLADALH